jgi:hypothetical protein
MELSRAKKPKTAEEKIVGARLIKEEDCGNKG